MEQFDIVFIGHMCFDEIVPFEGEGYIAPGSAVLCGAMAAGKIHNRVGVVTKLDRDNYDILLPMEDAGVLVMPVASQETSWMKVAHPTKDVDVRVMHLKHNAGLFTINEIPEFQTKHIHLAGISDQEFSLEFIQDLKKRNVLLSSDLQSFVRQADPSSKEVSMKDFAQKKEIIGQLDLLKCDMLEAGLVTGAKTPQEAALIFKQWGCSEIVITQSEGVFVQKDDDHWFQNFSNASIIGRTGRGDTTFAAYLVRRLTHSPADAIRFAAALVSIKMETPGPFNGTLEQVLERMNTKHPEYSGVANGNS